MLPVITDPHASSTLDPTLVSSATGLPLDLQRDYLDWLENHPTPGYQRRWRTTTLTTGIAAIALTLTHLLLR